MDKQSEFTDESSWEKVKNVAKTAGKEVLYNALLLYYTFPKASPKAKAIIVGALAYFISPIDVIPDVTPIIGYSDDLAILIAAVAAIGMEITQEEKDMVNKKLTDWFGE
jgi:uncharacterized membrane protein YkvA (DUF1232 family)